MPRQLEVGKKPQREAKKVIEQLAVAVHAAQGKTITRNALHHQLTITLILSSIGTTIILDLVSYLEMEMRILCNKEEVLQPST